MKKHWLDNLEKDEDFPMDSIPKPLIVHMTPPIWQLSLSEIEELIHRLEERKHRLLNQ